MSVCLRFPAAQRPGDKYLSGGRQTALHPSGVGQEDPPLLRAAAGRPGHPSTSRYVKNVLKQVHEKAIKVKSRQCCAQANCFQSPQDIWIEMHPAPTCRDQTLYK